MDPASKALWFIESHFAQDLELDAIARVAGVSRYHLSRTFSYGFGLSISQYVRGRRLTVAAQRLAQGAPDILAVALDSGYGSHEAFTRAFRDQFQLTPEALRALGNLDNLKLMEPFKMDQTLLASVEAPRFADIPTLLIAGIGERYTEMTSAAAPAQWQRLMPYLGHIPGQVGRTTYGVLCNADDKGSIEYVCGVEVPDFSRIPKEFSKIRIPEQRYAVFHHSDHVSAIRRTWFTIWNKWLPDSGYQATGGPEFERYDEQFDPESGNGGLEIWIPVRRKAEP